MIQHFIVECIFIHYFQLEVNNRTFSFCRQPESLMIFTVYSLRNGMLKDTVNEEISDLGRGLDIQYIH